jgi:hypothetical protein
MPGFDRNDTYTATIFLHDGRQEREMALRLGESFADRTNLPSRLKYKGEGQVGVLGLASEIDAHIWQSTGNLLTLVVATDRVILQLDALAVRELKNDETTSVHFASLAAELSNSGSVLEQDVKRLALATQRAGAVIDPRAVRQWIVQHCCGGSLDALADTSMVDDVTIRINERTSEILSGRETALNKVQSLGLEWQLRAHTVEEFLLKWSVDVNTVLRPPSTGVFSELECRAFFQHAGQVADSSRLKLASLEAL